jgi:molybdopterin molybdotransferase
MINYHEALDILKSHPYPLKVETVGILEADGRVLAEDIIADRNLPPYDRVTMDGIAINFDAFEKGQRQFEVLETIGAGVPQQTIEEVDKCVQIMTGAIMPKGLDTIIRYEDIHIDNGVATINEETIERQQNIHFKGEDRKQGEIVLEKGKALGPTELIVAAAVGKSELAVYQLPKAAIITTGDELVDINDEPAAHQIRRSSNYGVHALLNEWGITVKQFHLKDNKGQLSNELSSIIETYDLLVITGGVSRGKFDFLPEVLDELGVKKHFHKIKQRPGKPFWFGTSPNGATIFALPGNPVSSFVCANAYLKYWLKSSLGQNADLGFVKLANDVTFMPELTYFLECKVHTTSSGERLATTIKGNGSGDFDNMTLADGFVVLPEEKNEFFAGEVYPYIPYRNSI